MTTITLKEVMDAIRQDSAITPTDKGYLQRVFARRSSEEFLETVCYVLGFNIPRATKG